MQEGYEGRAVSAGEDREWGAVPHLALREQVVAVWMAHAALFVGITIIFLAGLDSRPPNSFMACEALIWLLLALPSVSYDRLVLLLERYFSGADRWQSAIRPAVQRMMVLSLLLTFVLQFVALTPVLIETGGPESPFAPLVLAFAVGAMMLSNRVLAGFLAALCSLLYYAILVLTYDPQNVVYHFSSSSISVAVFGLVIALAALMSSLDRIDRDRRLTAGSDPDAG